MNDNVRKIFDILGIEPNEKFKIQGVDNMTSGIFHMDENLNVSDEERRIYSLKLLLNGTYKIIKLPKKKKLRDLSVEEYKKWLEIGCHRCDRCDNCVFKNVICMYDNNCWVHHKDLYSDKFLDQEVEVE